VYRLTCGFDAYSKIAGASLNSIGLSIKRSVSRVGGFQF
jgi:hypothetical protein